MNLHCHEFFVWQVGCDIIFQVLQMVVVAGWQEAATEASLEMSHQETQQERKQQVWGGGMESLDQQGSRYFRLQASIFLKPKDFFVGGSRLFCERIGKLCVCVLML
jgi:predicted secreted protein